MNNKAIIFLKNFSYTLTSNLVSMIISAMIIAIIPKVLGTEEYGYWHLYLFYTSYTALLHFGWTDGIYLRYGGKEYETLDKQLFFSQFWMLVIFELIITLSVFGASSLFIEDTNKVWIFQMMVVCSLIVIPRGMLLFILQGTNRIKEYAYATLIGKVVYCCLILFFIAIGIREYQLMIIADIIGKLISLIYTVYCCKDIVFRKLTTFYLSVKETIENIQVGIKISLAFVTSTLIIGLVRFGIEYKWDIETFGKVSLTLSVSNLIMVFINALGMIMFPVLRRTEKDNLPYIYETMRTFLMVPMLGVLISYYPIKVILSAWLPQYSDSLLYMALLFPMCIYQGKMSLLINTYLKTLRKEKVILSVNIISVVVSLLLTAIFVILLGDLTMSVLSIVIVLAFRCIIAEIYLSKVLNISIYKDVTLEVIMTIVFIFTGWFLGSLMGVGIYLVAYFIYLVIKRKDIIITAKNIKRLAKK